jgi:hypothetical protein
LTSSIILRIVIRRISHLPAWGLHTVRAWVAGSTWTSSWGPSRSHRVWASSATKSSTTGFGAMRTSRPRFASSARFASGTGRRFGGGLSELAAYPRAHRGRRGEGILAGATEASHGIRADGRRSSSASILDLGSVQLSSNGRRCLCRRAVATNPGVRSAAWQLPRCRHQRSNVGFKSTIEHTSVKKATRWGSSIGAWPGCAL